MKIWDRGRLPEFGFDLRGTWIHSKACDWFYREVPSPPRKKRSEMTAEDLAVRRRYIRMASLSCFCEPCWRSFLPWPFSW